MGGTSDPDTKRRQIDASVDAALSEPYAQVPDSRKLAGKASCILVFPKVISAGFVVGGSYVEGALRKASASTAYYSVGPGSVGLPSAGLMAKLSLDGTKTSKLKL